MHFLSRPSRLRGCARRGRQGAVGTPMASHMASWRQRMLSLATKKAKQPPMAKGSRRQWLRSSEARGAAGLLRPMPKSELLRNLESKFTVLEWLAQLLGVVSIDLPAARSALEKI